MPLLILIGIFCANLAFTGHCNAQKNATYYADIAPIIHSKCLPCHRTGEVGIINLNGYEAVKRNALVIKNVIQLGYMPPWRADTTFSRFVGQKNLTLNRHEIDLLTMWVNNGTPAGDPESMSDLGPVREKRAFGIPDEVAAMKQRYLIRSGDRDEHRNYLIKLNNETKRYIQALEFYPGNKARVHHAWLFFDNTGKAREADLNDEGYGYDGFSGMGFEPVGRIPGYVPGLHALPYPTGVGKLFPEGADMVLQVHYSPGPDLDWDSSWVNIYYTKAPPQRLIRYMEVNENHLTNGPLFVEAGKSKRFYGQRTVDNDMNLVSCAPHLHYRWKNFLAYAITPANDTLKIIRINDWNFYWQGYYRFEKPLFIPSGSTIYTQGELDNTAGNPANPKVPPIDVRFGLRSIDEMFQLGLEYYLERDYFLDRKSLDE